MKFTDFPPHTQRLINETLSKKSPTDFRPDHPVAGLQPEVAKPNQRSEGKAGKLEGGEECRGFRIQFVCVRRRLLDEHDNLPMSCKQITDRTIERLGFSNDNDKRLELSYSQIKTTGREGVVVVIEPL